MACRLVGEAQLNVVEDTYSFLFDRNIFPPESHCKMFELFFGYLFVHNNNGIVQVTSFNKVVFQQVLQFMQENKSAAGSYFVFKVRNAAQTRMLGTQDGRIKVYKRC